MNNSAAHTALKAEILRFDPRRPGVRLFNNPVGEGWVGHTVAQDRGTILLANPRRVVFGLAPGSPDTIGWRTVTITPEMVGRRFAQFASPEIKTGTGRAREDQAKFIAAVLAAGGVAGVVRSPDDLDALLDGRDLFA